MPTPLEKRIVINAMRSADHGLKAVEGNIRIAKALLNEHGWKSEKFANAALHAIREAELAADVLHQAISDEALERAEDAPDDDVIEPLSGGGPKGGGG